MRRPRAPALDRGHRSILGRSIRDLDLRGISADTDFARFTEIAWHNPVAT